jgi:hypothetical protein
MGTNYQQGDIREWNLAPRQGQNWEKLPSTIVTVLDDRDDKERIT